jgi:parvulin-like peptidyl-prolyl isomerase
MEAEIAARAARIAEWKHRLVWFGSGCIVLAVAILIRVAQGDRPAAAEPAGKAAAKGDPDRPLPKAEAPQHDVMALVNGKDINRRQLTDACVRRFGEDVLESLVNKRLIQNHCAKRGVTVTNEEITAEIDRMAKRFQLGREQWLELLEKERGVSPQEYARDIVWPTLALRKLAAKQLEVTDAEITKAYEQEFGDMVRVRLIAVSNEQKARELHAQVTQNAEAFARVAIEHSEDVNSASIGGLIQPIRRHMGDKSIEDQAFALQPGQISPVIPVGEQFAILKCEEHIPARPVEMAVVREKLAERIKDEKLRQEAAEVFADVQKTATIQNVYNNPELRQTMPGVVALVNGDQVTMQELGAECFARHGEEVLEAEISQLLLEQSLEAAGLTVTQDDLNNEMRHAAELAGAVDDKGDVDLAKWVASVTKQQGISEEEYYRDSVWPSAALKKLTAQDVQVTDEDIQMGFEANYGERVRCRAIVLGNMRRAQEVWNKARQNQSPDYFGDLAEEYSVEPQSKALRGEVPPLGRYGGQPQLEEVAFQLQEGQLSGIVQVGDKFIILRCEGRTERVDVELADVQDILRRDIFEKKLRMAMGQKFEEINAKSRIDNYLAGTSRAPEKPKSAAAEGQPEVREDTAVRPTVAR